jgi:membrane peptidoglycan carboxypeptidase
MLEMANAYMHLSAQGKPAEMNPILEIRSQDGSILYQKTGEYQKEVIPA